MEPNEDRELSAWLREWEAPEAPGGLEGRVLARRDAQWRTRLVAAMALAAALGAAATVLVAPQPGPRRLVTAAVWEAPFVPLPNVLPLDSYEIGRVVRVDVPASTLIAVGYDMPMADRSAMVTADVLVGEDGRVHAVRLVSEGTSNGTGD